MNNMEKKHASEPFVRIAKRDSIYWWKAWGIRIAAIVAALVVDAMIIYFITKLNPIDVYVTMFNGAFGTPRRVWITLGDIMLLLCIAVGLAPAFKMRFWNVGAEGQVLVGGIATAACMIYLDNLPTALIIVIMFIVSAVAGAIWGLIPAIFKAKWDTNETLFTLMMNYVAIQLTSFMVSIWETPYGSNSVGIINQNTRAGWFPKMLGQNYTLNVILVMVITLAMFFYLKRSKHGYEIAVVGESRNTARYAGIDVKKVIVRTMLISGAVCGVAGMVGVAGMDHTISANTAGGRGFTAIIVAWMAKFNTITMILITALLIFLDRGAVEIASMYNLNEYASEMLMGVILFFLLGCEFFINYKLFFRVRKEGK